MNGPVAELDARASQQLDHAGAVRTMFDRIAPTYDLLNRVLSAGIDARWRDLAVSELPPAPSGPILDLCAGTMDLTALITKRFPDARVIAADFAAEMLKAGRPKAPLAEVMVADAMALPFGDRELGAVICGFGIRNVANVRTAIREVYRSLEKGGLFVTLEFFRPTRIPSRVFHAAYAKIVLPTVGGLVSGDSGAYGYLARSMKGFMTREEYSTALREAGFEKVRSYDLTFGIASIVVASRDS